MAGREVGRQVEVSEYLSYRANLIQFNQVCHGITFVGNVDIMLIVIPDVFTVWHLLTLPTTLVVGSIYLFIRSFIHSLRHAIQLDEMHAGMIYYHAKCNDPSSPPSQDQEEGEEEHCLLLPKVALPHSRV
ncbi:hypothetical protein TWF751_006103 [Orbilia oligospora]|nr:hypothetical protein TWF751_006103 [Orbilia oligospora]